MSALRVSSRGERPAHCGYFAATVGSKACGHGAYRVSRCGLPIRVTRACGATFTFDGKFRTAVNRMREILTIAEVARLRIDLR
jgi:hypothetical protein